MQRSQLSRKFQSLEFLHKSQIYNMMEKWEIYIDYLMDAISLTQYDGRRPKSNDELGIIRTSATAFAGQYCLDHLKIMSWKWIFRLCDLFHVFPDCIFKLIYSYQRYINWTWKTIIRYDCSSKCWIDVNLDTSFSFYSRCAARYIQAFIRTWDFWIVLWDFYVSNVSKSLLL